MIFAATKKIEQAFLDNDWKCRIIEEEKVSVVTALFTLKAGNEVTVQIFSTDDDDDAAIRIHRLCHAEPGKHASLLSAVNQANGDFRFAKFVLNDNGDVSVQADLPLNVGNVGAAALEITMRLLNIIDNVYPAFMKAIWG